MKLPTSLVVALTVAACAETQSAGGPDRGGADRPNRPSLDSGSERPADAENSDIVDDTAEPAPDGSGAGDTSDADADVPDTADSDALADADGVGDVSPDVSLPDAAPDTVTDVAPDVAADTETPDVAEPDVAPDPRCPTPGRRVLADLDGVYDLPPAIATHLRGLGYTLVDYSILDDAEIETSDVVIIASMNIHDLTTSGLRTFINDGGNVFVYATALSVSCNFNPTLQATGIQLGCSSNNSGTLNLDGHPSTTGLTRGSIPFGSSNWRVFASGGSTTARVASTSAGDVAMASEIGCGRALVWAAPDIGTSESATDFWSGALGWLTAAR